MAFDLTSTLQASHDFIHPELTNCTTSVQLKFDAPLVEIGELLFMGERASTVYMRSDRKIHTNEMNRKRKRTINRLLSYLINASISNIDLETFLQLT